MGKLSVKKFTNLFKKNKTSNIMREINKSFKEIKEELFYILNKCGMIVNE